MRPNYRTIPHKEQENRFRGAKINCLAMRKRLFNIKCDSLLKKDKFMNMCFSQHSASFPFAHFSYHAH